MRILVVEDDAGIARGLSLALRGSGWAVECVESVASALVALRTEPFDMVLLDLGLADGDGAQVLRHIRRSKAGGLPPADLPVMIMTARDQIASRIAGLDMGADDYVTKPFDAGEVAARIRALRRRFAGRADAILQWGNLKIDPAARTVHRDGQKIELSPREFSVLLALLEASPRVLSKAQLEASLYAWNEALESNAIEVHVHHIRKKLGPDVVATMRGVGYFVPTEPRA